MCGMVAWQKTPLDLGGMISASGDEWEVRVTDGFARGETLGNLLSSQAHGHLGSTGNLFWIDPARDGFCILFTSAERARAPWRLVATRSSLQRRLRGIRVTVGGIN